MQSPRLTPVLGSIGAHPLVIDPKHHDSLVAQLSHLPQILSTLLADQTAANKDLAGPGWKSVTRLAASPFHVWRDILRNLGSSAGGASVVHDAPQRCCRCTGSRQYEGTRVDLRTVLTVLFRERPMNKV